MDRIILHCDMNNFYASVECLDKPELKNVPVAVGGDVEKRHGIVLAKNELAKSFGIKTGDVLWEAKQKCPDLIFIKPHFDKYMEYSKKAFEIYSRFTCFVEPFGSDECWLDCTGSTSLFGDGEKIANSIREVIKLELGLTVSIGVSFNKIFAKLGSDLKKPDAVTVIDKSNFKEKIFHLPCGEMFGIGKKTSEKLAKLNIFSISDLANYDRNLLKRHFGKVGEKMSDNANGLDYERVREYCKGRVVKSVGHGMTAIRDITTKEDARVLINYLSDLIATRLRKYKLKGKGIFLDLRFNDLTSFSKSNLINNYVFTENEIEVAAYNLLLSCWNNKPIRTLTISVYQLKEELFEQLSMFDNSHTKSERLEEAIEKIRKKHGKDKIYKAALIGSEFIYDKTEAEDFLPFYRG